MKKLILEYRLTNHQKFILSLVPAVLLLFIMGMFSASLNFKGYIFVFLCSILFVFFVGMVFSRRGLVVKKDKLYIGVFYFNMLIFKKHIDLSEWTKLSILKFRRRQKFAFFTSANPDLSQRFNISDVCLLNEKHTRRLTLISLKNEKNAQNAIGFLSTNFNLKLEIYSPDLSL
jgi:hypothetical protein